VNVNVRKVYSVMLMKLQVFDLTGGNAGRVLLDTARENSKFFARTPSTLAWLLQAFELRRAQRVSFSSAWITGHETPRVSAAHEPPLFSVYEAKETAAN